MNIKDMKNDLNVIFAKASQVAERDIDEIITELDSVKVTGSVKQKYFAFVFVLIAFIELYDLPINNKELANVFTFFAGLFEKAENKK